MKEIDRCPLCNSDNKSLYIKTQDFSLTQQTFNIDRCAACSFLFTNPIPSAEKIADYYKFETYISHTNSDKGIINKLYKIIRNYSIRQKAKIIKKYQPGETLRLLDYGCGTGHFLAYMKNKGYQVKGFEPDDAARQFAQNKQGLIVESSLNKLDWDFDIITLWHVLEHIYDLNTTVDFLLQKLRKNGILIIAVPNPSSFDAKFYQKYWAAYDVPRHLYHFFPDVVIDYFLSKNMKLEKILPMFFDAFYVSMLSEKYKKGNLLRAIGVGSWSNWKAFLSKSPRYSSQIYIFRK